MHCMLALMKNLVKLVNGFRVNRLSLTVYKTFHMIVSNNKIEGKMIKIAGKEVKRADKDKFLGV